MTSLCWEEATCRVPDSWGQVALGNPRLTTFILAQLEECGNHSDLPSYALPCLFPAQISAVPHLPSSSLFVYFGGLHSAVLRGLPGGAGDPTQMGRMEDRFLPHCAVSESSPQCKTWTLHPSGHLY